MLIFAKLNPCSTVCLALHGLRCYRFSHVSIRLITLLVSEDACFSALRSKGTAEDVRTYGHTPGGPMGPMGPHGSPWVPMGPMGPHWPGKPWSPKTAISIKFSMFGHDWTFHSSKNSEKLKFEIFQGAYSAAIYSWGLKSIFPHFFVKYVFNKNPNFKKILIRKIDIFGYSIP